MEHKGETASVQGGVGRHTGRQRSYCGLSQSARACFFAECEISFMRGLFCLQVAGEPVKSKPTYVAIGDLHALPYGDEIGLSA